MLSQCLGQPVSGPLVLSIGGTNVAMRGVKMQVGCHLTPPPPPSGRRSSARGGSSRWSRLPSPDAPHMDGFGGRIHIEVRHTPTKLARCPPRQETVAARAVGLVAVTRREPGAQAPVRAFTAHWHRQHHQ
jgi:hypothetical protein